MKAILLNDSRSEDHIGCRIVMNQVLRECDRTGIQLLATSPTACGDDEQFVESWHREIDLVLVNGEGTMHDDQPKALGLARAVRRASSVGKRVVLFNTVWQNNVQLNQLLAHVDLVFCRESLSADAVRQAGFAAEVVPDVVFSASPDSVVTPRTSRRGIVVLDSVHGRLARRLAWRACRHACTYMPMNQFTYRKIHRRRLLRWALGLRCAGSPRRPGADFSEQLSRHTGAISGRFHGTCLCFLADLPVVSLSSNTHKIEGLYRDVGLDSSAVVRLDHRQRLPAMSELIDRIDYARSRAQDIRRYVTGAAPKIRTMFDRIRSAA